MILGQLIALVRSYSAELILQMKLFWYFSPSKNNVDILSDINFWFHSEVLHQPALKKGQYGLWGWCGERKIVVAFLPVSHQSLSRRHCCLSPRRQKAGAMPGSLPVGFKTSSFPIALSRDAGKTHAKQGSCSLRLCVQHRADVPAAPHWPLAGHLASCSEHADGPLGPPAHRNHWTSSRVRVSPVTVPLACLIPVLSQDATTPCSGKENALAQLYQGSRYSGKHISAEHGVALFIMPRGPQEPTLASRTPPKFSFEVNLFVLHCHALPSKDQRKLCSCLFSPLQNKNSRI